MHPTPQWYTIRVRSDGQNYESDEDQPPKLTGRKKKVLAITNGDSDTDDGMPDLQDVSDSSNDEYSESEEESDESSDDDDSDSEGGYDTDQEDEMREMLREAMDTAVEADWFSSAEVPKEIDPFLQEDRKGNPFLKLLGSLRGVFIVRISSRIR